MKIIFYVILLSLIYTGCASREDVSRALDSWIGSSKAELIALKGAPTNEYQIDIRNHIVVYDRDWYATYYDTGAYETCKIQFYVGADGIIYKTMWEHCSKKVTIENWMKK